MKKMHKPLPPSMLIAEASAYLRTLGFLPIDRPHRRTRSRYSMPRWSPFKIRVSDHLAPCGAYRYVDVAVVIVIDQPMTRTEMLDLVDDAVRAYLSRFPSSRAEALRARRIGIAAVAAALEGG